MTASGDIGGIVLLTLKVAGFGIGFGAPLALLLAYVLARFEFRFKALLSAIILLPLVLPPVVTGLILLEIFGPQGSAGRFFALFGFEFGFKRLSRCVGDVVDVSDESAVLTLTTGVFGFAQLKVIDCCDIDSSRGRSCCL